VTRQLPYREVVSQATATSTAQHKKTLSEGPLLRAGGGWMDGSAIMGRLRCGGSIRASIDGWIGGCYVPWGLFGDSNRDMPLPTPLSYHGGRLGGRGWGYLAMLSSRDTVRGVFTVFAAAGEMRESNV